MDNYRPTSILPTVSKLLERVVLVQLCDYLREHNILSPYQCAFRKQHSPEFAALSLADTRRRNVDQGQMTGAVFIDFCKAFYSVNHSLLLKTLYALGIVDQEYEWFTDYLKGRTQVVGFQGAFSDAESICVGVPQGSILGPLSLPLHVNDIPTVARRCSMLMYADGTVLFYFGKVAATIEKSLTEDLDLIGSWLYNNSLFLNAVKTEAMLFGTHARLSDADFGITFKGRPIKRVFEFKYLGVIFDEHISWNSHVRYVLSRYGKRLRMLERIRENLTSDCANSIYTAYIRPIMDYCDTVWNCCGVGNSSSLERLQRRAAKIVSKTGDSDRALDYLKWPSVVNRGESHVNELVKRCIKGKCPQFFKNYSISLSTVLSTIELRRK